MECQQCGEIDSTPYKLLHKWVRRTIPVPTRCQKCGENKKLDAANISGEYKKVPEDWIYICRRCHMVIDGRIKTWNRKRIDDMKSGRAKPVGLHPREKDAPRNALGRYC